MKPGRRNLLTLGGIVGVIYGLRAVPWGRFPGRGLEFVAIDGLPPFRAIETGGQISSGSVAFIGLDPPDGNSVARRRNRLGHKSADAQSLLILGILRPGSGPEQREERDGQNHGGDSRLGCTSAGQTTV